MNKYLILLVFALIASTSSCNAQKAISGKFTHGIASGDPAQESVLLWTRFLTDDNIDAAISWEIAKDKSFTKIVNQGTAMAKKENDFCVKVIADQLESGTRYYYRFFTGKTYSEVGRTNTLPDKVEELKIGVINCAKYTGGYYHAYETLANMEVDVVIHVGDYIYENDAAREGGSYYPAFLATGRQHEPPHECYSLQDYRTRYAQYRADTSLLKLHAKFPMIAIWDDHEIAMKPLQKKKGYEKFGGSWEERLDNSIQAYHEWIPLRPEKGDLIYRSFQFGDLVNLLMLDTRVCCKDEVTKTKASLQDTSRHIIGNEQLQWIKDEVTEHDAHWNVFGNQLLIAIKDMGWNRWPGFPYDRDRFVKFVEENPKKNFVFTTGNAHNPHHYIIFNEAKTDTLFHEFCPGSISSGNNAEKAFFDEAVLAKNAKKLDAKDNLLWYHQNSHGFIVLNITKEKLVADWHFVSSIRKQAFTSWKEYSVELRSKKL